MDDWLLFYSYYLLVRLPRTFNGVIDEVKLYNQALTQEQVQASAATHQFVGIMSANQQKRRISALRIVHHLHQFAVTTLAKQERPLFFVPQIATLRLQRAVPHWIRCLLTVERLSQVTALVTNL